MTSRQHTRPPLCKHGFRPLPVPCTVQLAARATPATAPAARRPRHTSIDRHHLRGGLGPAAALEISRLRVQAPPSSRGGGGRSQQRCTGARRGASAVCEKRGCGGWKRVELLRRFESGKLPPIDLFRDLLAATSGKHIPGAALDHRRLHKAVQGRGRWWLRCAAR